MYHFNRVPGVKCTIYHFYVHLWHHLNLWLLVVISVMIKLDVLMSWMPFKELELTFEWSVGSVRYITQD